MSVSADQGHGIRQYRTRDSISRSDSNSRGHGLFGLFGDDTGVKLHKVRVLIEIAKLISNFRVRVDLLECFMGLQAKELAELVEGTNVPPASLVNTQNLNGLKSLGDVPSTERAYKKKSITLLVTKQRKTYWQHPQWRWTEFPQVPRP